VCCDGGVVANAPAQTAFNTMYFLACIGDGGKKKFGLDDVFWKNRFSQTILDKFDVTQFPNHMVLSIGCGQTAKEVDSHKAPNGSLRSYIFRKGNLIDVLMSSNSQLSHANMDALFASRNAWKNYLRIQLSINDAVGKRRSPGFIQNKAIVDALSAMDDASEKALEVYKDAGEYLAKVYEPLIKRFVQRMLEKKEENCEEVSTWT
jgi:hypothetical protein